MSESKTAEAIRKAIVAAEKIGYDDVAGRLSAILQRLDGPCQGAPAAQ